VEDDASISQAFERILHAGGFEVVAFASAEAALEAGALATAACLVLDIRLPGMCGLELLRHLVRGGSNVPVIIVTAHDEPAIRKEAEDLGVKSFLVKPFPGLLLLDAVARALRCH
jgi:FixJ family two-component response regulator